MLFVAFRKSVAEIRKKIPQNLTADVDHIKLEKRIVDIPGRKQFFPNSP